MVGNRRHIPESVKQQWVTMSAHMKSRDIAHVTHSGHRTVNRVLRLSRLTGSVIHKPLQAGCPRLLTSSDATVSSIIWHAKLSYYLHNSHQYLEACVERTPDIFLHELQSALWDARGINVSLQTIEKTLWRHGFTRKKVLWPKTALCFWKSLIFSMD